MRHTGHPVPVAHGAHPCAPPYGCAFVLASSKRRSAGWTARLLAQAKAEAEEKPSQSTPKNLRKV